MIHKTKLKLRMIGSVMESYKHFAMSLHDGDYSDAFSLYRQSRTEIQRYMRLILSMHLDQFLAKSGTDRVDQLREVKGYLTNDDIHGDLESLIETRIQNAILETGKVLKFYFDRIERVDGDND